MVANPVLSSSGSLVPMQSMYKIFKEQNFKVLWPNFGPVLGCISQTIKKVARVQAKPLQNLEDLAHTVDERFVLAFLAKVPISPLESPPTAEETLIQLYCLLSWCCLVLKQLADQRKNAGRMDPEKPNLQPGEIGY
ncbi:hypothetical protein DSO57_1013733 [Entomophthora muscae]|uniref:Uncharacterized protein n=1 Tax=Entomophthora muscae TaxID=34485 RepID=A0ACC2UR54_9FUNG|nr:hypothetical protein DSO57_1013733 [Entomophthora muscae]